MSALGKVGWGISECDMWIKKSKLGEKKFPQILSLYNEELCKNFLSLPHVYLPMSRISCRPKVQTAVSSQVMCELKMNRLRKRLEKCLDRQMLLPPQGVPVLATVLGDVLGLSEKVKRRHSDNNFPRKYIHSHTQYFSRYFLVSNLLVPLHQASRLSPTS